MSALPQESALEIRKLKEHIGAEATGVDLSRPLDEVTIHHLEQALVENVALVIRGQHLTATQYRKAMEQFGALMEDQNRLYLAEGEPLVSVLSNRLKASDGQPAKVGANATWHTDHTNQERPPKFTCLYGVEVPSEGGGTSVCNTRAAYAALPEARRRELDGLETANTLISSARFKIANPDILAEQLATKTPPMVHPLIRTHPDTGTKAIWFHKSKTETVTGLNAEETQDFLEELLEETVRPEFTFMHQWKKGDLLMIDNRSALHKAGHDYDHREHRHLLRILVRGDRPN